jgi:hypothetical protein
MKLMRLLEQSNIRLGDCRNEELVEDIFGSVSEFARLVEKHGNNFSIGNIVVKYNPTTDVHTFWQKK